MNMYLNMYYKKKNDFLFLLMILLLSCTSDLRNSNHFHRFLTDITTLAYSVMILHGVVMHHSVLTAKGY